MITVVVPSVFQRRFPFYGYKKSARKLQFHITLKATDFKELEKMFTDHCKEDIVACWEGKVRHVGGVVDLDSGFVDKLLMINEKFREAECKAVGVGHN